MFGPSFTFVFFSILGVFLDTGLREKLNKIMASDYFTTTPQIIAPIQVAAAVGNFTSFQDLLHRSIIPHAGVIGPVEGSASGSEQEVESYFYGLNNCLGSPLANSTEIILSN